MDENQTVMTFKELIKKIKNILPEYTYDWDNNGQVIIYTNLKFKKDNDEELVRFEDRG